MTGIKTALFILFVPGTVLVVIPLYWILPADPARVDPGPLRWLALPFWVAGVAILCWCAVDFVRKGHGTPAPIEPPKELVAGGLYRFVRNPMYVGVLLTAVGHSFWFGSFWLAGYALFLWLVFHGFVTFYEEPHLHKTFGTTYEQYCKAVPRWMPNILQAGQSR